MKSFRWTLIRLNAGKRLLSQARWSAPVLLLSAVLLCGCKTVTPSSWYDLRYSPDGTRIAAFRVGGGATEFDVQKDLAGRPIEPPFDQQTGSVLDLNYNASGDLLLLCHVTNELTVWNTGKEAAVAQRPLHSSLLGGRLSRNGERAALCFAGKQGGTNVAVALIDLKSGGNIIEFPEHEGLLDFVLSGGGERLATVDGKRVGRVWNAQTGQLLLEVPGDHRKPVGIALDEHGNNLALIGTETRLQRLDAVTNQPAVSVPNATPKASTTLGGVGLIMLQAGTVLIGNGYVAWDPYWFKTAPTLGVCLSDDGKRVAMINSAPNLKGTFQIRVADAQTGRLIAVRDLPASFMPCGPPVFSPNSFQVAVPGNGVQVLDCPTSGPAKPQDLWVGKDQPAPPSAVIDRHEIPHLFKVEPARITNSISSLARASHRRVSLEETVNASGQPERWTVPLGLGMKSVFYPNKSVGVMMNECLTALWRDCGHEVVHWDADLHLSSRVTQWQLEVERSVFKGWSLTAVIEVEVELKDRAGTVLHTARYAGKNHEAKLFEPSCSLIGKMHAHALNACLTEMKDDPKWEQALATGAPVSPKSL